MSMGQGNNLKTLWMVTMAGAVALGGVAAQGQTAAFGPDNPFYAASTLPYQAPPFINAGYGAGFTTTNPTGALSVPYASPSLAAKPPYYENWSFGLQRQLTSNMSAGASYSASAGHLRSFSSAHGGITGTMRSKRPCRRMAASNCSRWFVAMR